jgi:hypothetical protein
MMNERFSISQLVFRALLAIFPWPELRLPLALFVSPLFGVNSRYNPASRNLAPASLSPVRQPPGCTLPQLSQMERSLSAAVSKAPW